MHLSIFHLSYQIHACSRPEGGGCLDTDVMKERMTGQLCVNGLAVILRRIKEDKEWLPKMGITGKATSDLLRLSSCWSGSTKDLTGNHRRASIDERKKHAGGGLLGLGTFGMLMYSHSLTFLQYKCVFFPCMHEMYLLQHCNKSLYSEM